MSLQLLIMFLFDWKKVMGLNPSKLFFCVYPYMIGDYNYNLFR
jgi:hypothetical protein